MFYNVLKMKPYINNIFINNNSPTKIHQSSKLPILEIHQSSKVSIILTYIIGQVYNQHSSMRSLGETQALGVGAPRG